MKTISDLDISGKCVFIRVDFNVPLDDRFEVGDDTRIKAALPTLHHAISRNARLIIASHLGRPGGKPVDAFSLRPVSIRLSQLLGKTVQMAPDCVGAAVKAMVDRMGDGDVVLLENLRFHPEEEKNDADFARRLADLCDVYVNDAFAVSHRAHASVEAITHFVPNRGAGRLLAREISYFRKAMAEPERPLVAVVGGAKVSGKLAALENLMQHVDKIVIGGAMANTFLKSAGYAMGSSKIEEGMIETARSVMAKAREKQIKLYLPVDAVAAERVEAGTETIVVPVQEIPGGWMVLDIGPATSLLFNAVLHDAATIIWNGPMGVFEVEHFSRGTLEMARSIAASRALSIVGGGDTDAAVHKSGQAKDIGYISTGGGAFLALLEGKTLPAVAALNAA